MQRPDWTSARNCPSCNALAEPDEDGDLTFYACPLCGHEFGYRRRTAGSAASATCAAGIPVHPEATTPLLHIGKRAPDATTA
jgi:predicted RNA-binding Zn-ribbon protein involved in translation (DUF1610 family)